MTAWIEPDWPPLEGVRAAFSLRTGGVSPAPWDTFNLACHVGDAPDRVATNRERLRRALMLPGEPCWLQQVHGKRVVEATAAWQEPRADAVWTRQPGRVCVVMVADCLPVLLRDAEGRCVAAIHAGWRGLAAGIIERTLAELEQYQAGARWQAWLGPCLGPGAFEVGPEVRAAFLADDTAARTCFAAGRGDRWWADLPALARQRLNRSGVADIWGGKLCTWRDRRRFFSYRRDGVTGRMAALIWRA